MQAKLPPNTRRDFDWVLGLSSEGLLVACSGVVLTLIWWHLPWPLGLRVPLMFLTVTTTIALAWGRYPFSDGGDRLTVWAGRLWRYLTQHRHVLFHEGSGHHHGRS